MHNGHKGFEDIKAWKVGREFKKNIYSIVRKFPKEELFAITQQIRRAVVSITANIAEGYGRYHFQENIQFCRIARGSTNEVLDHLYSALDFNYITKTEFDLLYKEGRDVEYAINGYINFMNQQKNKER